MMGVYVAGYLWGASPQGTTGSCTASSAICRIGEPETGTSTPLSVPALQHPVTCPVPYSSPAQLVHPDGLLREANCLDSKHGFEWYCGDPKRALMVSQDGSKAWCERGPE